MRVQDLVTWNWVRSGRVTFAQSQASGRFATVTRRQLQGFCTALLHNFLNSSTYQPPRRAWCHTTTGDFTRTRGNWSKAQDWYIMMQHCVSLQLRFDDMKTVEALITADSGQPKKVAVVANPAMTRLVCVWAGDRRWTVSKRQYRKALHPKSRSTATAVLNCRLTFRQENPYKDPAVSDDLNALPWQAPQTVVGLNAVERQQLLRIKSARVSGWIIVRSHQHARWKHAARSQRPPSAKCFGTAHARNCDGKKYWNDGDLLGPITYEHR